MEGLLLIRRKDPAQGAALHAWIDHHILARFEGRVPAVDTAMAQHCARANSGGYRDRAPLLS